ncbi:MAG: NAD-dependent epimerase/dehydratase family protein [Candidatus Omnitrophica bacterium]|nr:NAD-dependent epimerase/dehydratase family protein [Candidatus Omnitrophota bacterium]
MRDFVIGGAGFIGSHLTGRLLQAGRGVTVFDNLSTGKRSFLRPYEGHPGFRFVRGDVLSLRALRSAMKGCGFVYHLAANADIMRAMKDPGLDFYQGVVATFYVLEAMRGLGLKPLVYFSGSGVYGDYGLRSIPEDAGPLRPQSMYGAAKLSSEAMISAYSHLYGIRAWIFRPANIIGPRPTHGVIYDFIRKLKRDPRRLAVLGDGSQSKSYLHVEDLLDAVFLAVRRARAPVNAFNVGSRTSVTVREIARVVAREMGLRRVRFDFGRGARGWKGDIPKVRLDIRRLSRLGWSPRLNSREAVVRCCREILGCEDRG